MGDLLVAFRSSPLDGEHRVSAGTTSLVHAASGGAAFGGRTTARRRDDTTQSLIHGWSLNYQRLSRWRRAVRRTAWQE